MAEDARDLVPPDRLLECGAGAEPHGERKVISRAQSRAARHHDDLCVGSDAAPTCGGSEMKRMAFLMRNARAPVDHAFVFLIVLVTLSWLAILVGATLSLIAYFGPGIS